MRFATAALSLLFASAAVEAAEKVGPFAAETRTFFTTADGLSSNYIFAIGETPDGAIWIGTTRGVNRYQSGRFTGYEEIEGAPTATVRAVRSTRTTRRPFSRV